jgi:acetate kinase
MNILVINCGSSSVKYQVIDTNSQTSLKKGHIESISPAYNYQQAMATILDYIKGLAIDAVGHRVVHGGDQFHKACLIDNTVINAIEDWSAMAPLHNPNNLMGIRAAQQMLPDVPHIAVFDTAFHANMPRRASTYAIDHEIAREHRIKRYGFHGTSHSYVAEKAAEFLQRPLAELRIISLHLGNGASACAIEFGHSAETSMGMTPLEGLVMGSRCGDIDAGIVLMLARDNNLSIKDIDNLLNRNSGIKGLSGISHDVRDIEAAAAEGNDNARLAITVFAHHVRKYIGAYAAVMGGVDAIVLTGGIGENSATMRQRILQRLDFLGIVLDDDLNLDAQVSHEKPVISISRSIARVQTLVIKTNEELKIAQEVESVIKRQQHTRNPGPIPIAVSARHIHLNAETFALLFGADAQPTHYKDLRQPGQYACAETMNLIGPRGRIEKVRLLGPLRSKNQVEISRTDEFHLGIDAPVRDSGHTEGSAPITVEGPNGIIHLQEGLICARRHIHMHPDDARFFGVKDKDEVEVAITGGERDLVFCDVLVRVHKEFVLEMHIDTDEANAAELDQHSDGTLVYDAISSANASLRTKH